MARTIPDVITEARKLLQDTRASSYRYSDAYLIGLLNLALQEIYRLRPDAFIGCCTDEDIAVPTYVEADAADNTKTFPIDAIFFLATVYHIVGNAQLADDEFADDNRAIVLLRSFRDMLVGPGG